MEWGNRKCGLRYGREGDEKVGWTSRGRQEGCMVTEHEWKAYKAMGNIALGPCSK